MIAEILDPISPGLDKDVFFARLQNDIETATARLVAEGRSKMVGEPDAAPAQNANSG